MEARTKALLPDEGIETHMNIYHRWLCRSSGWKTALENTLLPWALDGVELGDHLLEVGPGPGLTTDLLRVRVPRLTALEIDLELSESLKRRLASTNVEVLQGDGTNMQFDDQTFSSAVALTMLHHVPSVELQDKLLAEVYRILRKGGMFAGIDSLVNLRFRLIHLGDTMVVVNPDTFSSRLEAAGFTNIRVEKNRQRFRFRAMRAR